MNISTVAENLRNTIAGKEKMLTTLQARVGLERAGIDQVAFIATVNFLEINIAELQRVLQDVEQCTYSQTDIDNYEQRIATDVEQSWRDNPDRSGGSFTAEELDPNRGWK